MIDVEIDAKSGFCFGVVTAITRAEEALSQGDTLYCLGDIVHNELEVERLAALGLRSIDHKQFSGLREAKVLFRAHGEPPLTYQMASDNRVMLIDATCPVVLRLQEKIKNCYLTTRHNHTQVVIYGKSGHAEVNGLVGQTNNEAIVIEKMDDLSRINLSLPIALFSQTTQSVDGFNEMVSAIQSRMDSPADFTYYDTICRQVSNRLPHIKAFAQKHDWIYFVAGKKSSNGRVLFEACLATNPHTQFISHTDQVVDPLPDGIRSVGVCGATSTPKWLMEAVAQRVIAVNAGAQQG
jgi:4-hydroxy-3-methylbut-2-enyl diphosphate reductase